MRGVRMPGKIGLPRRGMTNSRAGSIWSAGTMVWSLILLSPCVSEKVRIAPAHGQVVKPRSLPTCRRRPARSSLPWRGASPL